MQPLHCSTHALRQPRYRAVPRLRQPVPQRREPFGARVRVAPHGADVHLRHAEREEPPRETDGLLWVDKYSPKSFQELLSDEVLSLLLEYLLFANSNVENE